MTSDSSKTDNTQDSKPSIILSTLGPGSPIVSMNIRDKLYEYTFSLMGDPVDGSGTMFSILYHNGIKNILYIILLTYTQIEEISGRTPYNKIPR